MYELLALSARSASNHPATQMIGDANTRMIATTTPTLRYMASSFGFSLLAFGTAIQGTKTCEWTGERPLPQFPFGRDQAACLSQTLHTTFGRSCVSSDLFRRLPHRKVLMRWESVVD